MRHRTARRPGRRHEPSLGEQGEEILRCGAVLGRPPVSAPLEPLAGLDSEMKRRAQVEAGQPRGTARCLEEALARRRIRCSDLIEDGQIDGIEQAVTGGIGINPDQTVNCLIYLLEKTPISGFRVFNCQRTHALKSNFKSI